MRHYTVPQQMLARPRPAPIAFHGPQIEPRDVLSHAESIGDEGAEGKPLTLGTQRIGVMCGDEQRAGVEVCDSRAAEVAALQARLRELERAA